MLEGFILSILTWIKVDTVLAWERSGADWSTVAFFGALTVACFLAYLAIINVP